MYFVASLRSRLLFLCLSASHAGCCCYRGSQHLGGGPRYTICSHPLQLRKNTLSDLITCSWRLSIPFLLLTHQEACFVRIFVKRISSVLQMFFESSEKSANMSTMLYKGMFVFMMISFFPSVGRGGVPPHQVSDSASLFASPDTTAFHTQRKHIGLRSNYTLAQSSFTVSIINCVLVYVCFIFYVKQNTRSKVSWSSSGPSSSLGAREKFWFQGI